MSGEDQFDAIVIGTSPLMILEALRLDGLGQRVVLLDRASVIGGAWHVTDLGGFTGVETGCHYFERHPEAYSVIETALRLKLEVMDPQPFQLWRRLKFDRGSSTPARLESFIYPVRRFTELLKAGQFRVLGTLVWCRLRQKVRHLLAEQGDSYKGGLDPGDERISYHASRDRSELTKEQRQTQYQYPRYGCLELVSTLQALLAESTVQVQLGTTVDSIVINRTDIARTYCQTKSGTLIASEVILSSCSVVSQLVLDGQKIDIPATTATQHHVILHLKGRITKRFSYVEFYADEILLRISDVGYYSERFQSQQGLDEHLICTHITATAWERHDDPKERAAAVLLALQAKGVVSRETEVVNQWNERFPTSVIPSHHVEKLRKITEPNVRWIYTYNFSFAAAEYSKRVGFA